MPATATYEALLSSIQTLTHPCMPAQHRRRALRGTHAAVRRTVPLRGLCGAMWCSRVPPAALSGTSAAPVHACPVQHAAPHRLLRVHSL